MRFILYVSAGLMKPYGMLFAPLYLGETTSKEQDPNMNAHNNYRSAPID